MNLYDTESDGEREIKTMAELRAELPTVPRISIWVLSGETSAVELRYGSPDRDHAEVVLLNKNDAITQPFTTYAAATTRFLELAATALP